MTNAEARLGNETGSQDITSHLQGTAEELADTLAQRYTLEELCALSPFDIASEHNAKFGLCWTARDLAKQKLRGFKGGAEELAKILKQRMAQGDLSVTQPEMVAKEFRVELSFAQGACSRANPPKPRQEPQPEHQRGQENEPDSWQPVDLGPYLRGEIIRATPTVGLARSDGLRMLYPGKEHSIIGEMESGKSWFSLASVQAELEAGNTVLYLHFEEADPSDTIGRLQALGVPDDDIEKRFRFIAPQRQVSTDSLNKLLTENPSLVVFDGVNEAMSLHRWGIRDEDGVAQFRRHLVMPCLVSGAATLACDHVVKDRDNRGRNALGSIHKGNGLSGSLILLENAEPFGRGQRGASHVLVTKDRPGHLRQHGRPDKMPGKTFMGTLSVDATLEPLELRFWAPREEAAPAEETDRAEVLGAVIALNDAGMKPNIGNIRSKAGKKNEKVRDILTDLVIDGKLREEYGPRGAILFLPVPETP